MPVCLAYESTSNGITYVVLQNPQPADMTTCSAGVMLAPTEYYSYQMPPTDVLAQAFGAGFLIPMAGYVFAYLAGRLVAMFDDRRDN